MWFGKAWSHLDSQVLKTNAMYGRTGAPPMDKKEMMEVAKEILLKAGEFGYMETIMTITDAHLWQAWTA